MKYRVFWDPYAEGQLKRIFQKTLDHSRIIAAVRGIDTQLMSDPIHFGESRFDEFRIGFVLPIAVLYELLEDVRTVIVCEVWHVE